jgi:HAE1 family hydrophobic/amphiphilic exporter-1
MDLIRFSIEKPVTVMVGIILVVLFGVIGLFKMPYQLSPTVTEPEITVTTTWTGATPYEVEREIIEEQEQALKGIPGLVEMESSAFNSMGTITLRFRVGTDVDDALLRVSNKLNEVPDYPVNVDRPVINATGSATSPVIWMIMKTGKENPRSIDTYRTYFENDIRQYLERIDGVADLFIAGGTEREMQIRVSPERLASYGLTIGDLIAVLRAENINVSAGNMGVGRRDFRIRTVAEYNSPEDIENVVIRSTGQERILLRDVADVGFGYQKVTVAMMHNGNPGIAVGIKPEPGTNVLEMTDRAEKVVRWLNEEKLKPRGIYLDWVYDQRPYIRGAIGLVKQNILIGGMLAIAVLILFLRSLSSTVIVATAIPISVLGTFIVLYGLGRNLNVVSLAGIAFAVGMLVDSAIVVLENIDRHRGMGKGPFDSAYDGTKEVWGAVLASTLTTVAVFLPVVFIQEEAGQLFKDIAIAVSCAVILSLFVSVSVIPMFSGRLFTVSGKKRLQAESLVRLGHRLVDMMMALVGLATRNWGTRLATILLLTAFSLVSMAVLFPKMEYLPQGNRNLVISFLIPPPGLSYEERKETGEQIFRETRPFIGQDRDGFPAIRNLFYVGSDRVMLFGATSVHDDRAGELVPLFRRIISTLPGIFGVSNQAGIFQTRLGRGRTIDLDISGDNLQGIVRIAGAMFGMIKKEIPGAQIRPIPSLELLYPEVKLIPRRDRLRAEGMTSAQMGVAIDVIMDGRKIGEFKREGEKKIDLVMKTAAGTISTPEELYRALIVTPGGKVVPLSSLTEMEKTSGITEIRHLERKRTITLQITPPFEMPLQEAMERVRERVIAPLDGKGMLRGVDVTMSGAADKLTETRKILQLNFLLAAVIAYLLMAALFGNFIYPLIIMFTVPLAGAGGFIGLKLVNIFIKPQPLDILTMLGFVILIGVVVNNAILIVHQALNNIRLHGMDHRKAVLESTRTRLRPIYMSAFTSIFGMLPLVVAPGPGSELYRGLGSVILGGLALSTVFTVFVIPALLMFVIRMEKVKVNARPLMLVMILLSGLASPLHALTLDEAISIALENNHKLKEYSSLVDARKSRVEAERASFLPEANLTYSFSRQDNVFSFFQTKESSILSAEVSYNLFNGFSDLKALKAEEAQLEAAVFQKRAVKADVIFAVKKAYIGVLRAAKTLEVASEAVRLLEKQYRDASLFYREGMIARNDLLKVEVELYSARESLIRREGDLRIARRRLERVMGRPVSDEGLEEADFKQDKDPDESRLREEMFSNRSELKYLSALKKARRYRLEGIRGGYMPALDLSLVHDRYGDSYIPDGRPDLFDTQTRALVTARWNIFDGFRRYNTAKAEESEIRAIEERIRDTREELSLQLRTAIENYMSAKERVEVAGRSVKQAEENYRITENRFRQRMSTPTDLLDARFLLTRARNDYVNALYDLYVSIAGIERVVEGE